MSLLLDALKKAAEDKKKSEQLADEEQHENLLAEDGVSQAVTETELPEAELPGSLDELELIEPENKPLQTPQQENSPETVSDIADEEPEFPPVDETLDLDLDINEAQKQSGDSQQPDAAQIEDEELTEYTKPQNVEPAVVNATTDEEQVFEDPDDRTESEPVSAANQSEPDAADIKLKQVDTDQTQPATLTAQQAPVYNHDDATRVIQVARQRYQTSRRIMFYISGLVIALLFFFITYIYYSAQSLDNTRPIMSPTPRNQQAIINREPAAEVKSTEQVQLSAAEVDKPGKLESSAVKKVKTHAVKKPAPITIIKSKKDDPIAILLSRAYKKYQQTEYDAAKRLYQKVLNKEADQRDALLGVAAIALINKDYVKARRLYQQLLRLNPKDNIAHAALVDLEKRALVITDESKLKVLLRETPNAAYLHFSLGLLYAKQQKWPQAQQAFFNAYSRDKNGDYAYNLGVALDRIDKPEAALAYYKVALEYADKHAINFNEKAALNRIEAIEANHE